MDRSNGDYPEGFDQLIREELQEMTKLSLTVEEEAFMRHKMPYLPPIYIDFLKGFRFDPSEVDVRLENRKLHIRATGLLYRVTLWETPILAIVSELFFKTTGQAPDLDYMERVTIEKAKKLQENNIA